MPNEHTIYLPEQFSSLSTEAQAALHTIAENLTGERIDLTDAESLGEVFNVLHPCDGCIPEEEISDDVLCDIRRKFASIYYASVLLAEAILESRGLRAFEDFAFCLVIDPSYEDATHTAVVDYQSDERPVCYFHTYCKAWHFSFDSLGGIAAEVLRARDAILQSYWRTVSKHGAAFRPSEPECGDTSAMEAHHAGAINPH
jgi:hypothetical protein